MPIDAEAYLRGDIPSLSVHPDSPHWPGHAESGRALWPFVATAASGHANVRSLFLPPTMQHSQETSRTASLDEVRQQGSDRRREVVQHIGWSVLGGPAPLSPGGRSDGGQSGAMFADAVTQHFGGRGPWPAAPVQGQRVPNPPNASFGGNRGIRSPDMGPRPWSIRLPDSVVAAGAAGPGRSSMSGSSLMSSIPNRKAPSTSAPLVQRSGSILAPAERLPRKPATLDVHHSNYLASPPGPRASSRAPDTTHSPIRVSDYSYDRTMPPRVADTSRPGLYSRYTAEVGDKSAASPSRTGDDGSRVPVRLDDSTRPVVASRLRDHGRPSVASGLDSAPARITGIASHRGDLSPSPLSPEMARTPVAAPTGKLLGDRPKSFVPPMSARLLDEYDRYEMHPSPGFEAAQVSESTSVVFGAKRNEPPLKQRQYVTPGFPKPTREVAWNREGPAMLTHGVAWLRLGEIGEEGLPKGPKGARTIVARPPESGRLN